MRFTPSFSFLPTFVLLVSVFLSPVSSLLLPLHFFSPLSLVFFLFFFYWRPCCQYWVSKNVLNSSRELHGIGLLIMKKTQWIGGRGPQTLKSSALVDIFVTGL